MSARLVEAARAVLARWHSTSWAWGSQGPTADLMADLQRALAEAEAQPAQEHITVEAVAEVIMLRNGELDLAWLIEGGICALPKGVVLLTANKPITDDEGSGEVYRAASTQAAAPTSYSPRDAYEDGDSFAGMDDKPTATAAPLVAELPLLTDERIGQLYAEHMKVLALFAWPAFARAVEGEVRAALARAGEGA